MAMSAKNETAMEQVPETIQTQSKGLQWTGRVFTALTVLFMLFDAVGRICETDPGDGSFCAVGIADGDSDEYRHTAAGEHAYLCDSRTAVLGAVLLTGYLGGAVSIHLRAGSTVFEQVFPVILGVMSVGRSLFAGVWIAKSISRKTIRHSAAMNRCRDLWLCVIWRYGQSALSGSALVDTGRQHCREETAIGGKPGKT